MTVLNQPTRQGGETTLSTYNYNAIDVMKFIGAILVLMIHVTPLQGEVSQLGVYINHGLQHYICRLAVPFYFVASGFFLFRKMPLDEINVPTIKDYCVNIARLFGVWTVLLFIGVTGHLWYLSATIIAVVVLALCLYRKIKLKYIRIMALACYVIGMLGDTYYGLTARVPIVKALFDKYIDLVGPTRNGLFMGFAFVLIGATFAHRRSSIKAKTALIGFCLSMVGLFGEVFVLIYFDIAKDYNMYAFLLPTTFFLFSFLSTLKLKDSPIYRRLRSVGSLIYFLHMLFYKVVSLAVEMFRELFSFDLSFLIFATTLVVTVAVAFGIEALSHKEKFKWIKWFVA